MYSFETWLHAADIVMQWQTLLLIFGVSIIGMIIGFLPGIGPLTAMPLFIPLTYGMSPALALIVLAVLYMSTVYGGSVSAILLNTPGTAASAATCLDGYPLAKQGRGGFAIGISMMSSFIGGFIGLAGLIFLSPVIAQLAMNFQPAEYFMLAVLGLVLIAASAKGSLVKSFVSGAFGVIVSCVGMDLMTGYSRFTFGTTYLKGGFPFVSLIIGLFAFSEVIALGRNKEQTISETGKLAGRIMDGLKEPFKYPWSVLRASLIGLGIGVIPGEAAAVANFTAYLAEVRASKHPETFGTGAPEGVIAPEASNNACVAGALIPTLTLGIPGGGVAAIFMGGLMVHGLNPGFELYTEHLDVLYILFFGLVVANVIMFASGTLLSKYAAKVTLVPISILTPTIIALGITSTYLIRGSVLDVTVAIAAGILGFLMREFRYSPIPFLVAFILSPIAEKSFFQALMLADGSYWTFVRRPISGLLFATCVAVLVVPPILKKARGSGPLDIPSADAP
ncbi:MAG: tripartite tricarboxylate transporter permease [Deferrisomatales bacterium]|nr:tripartite tricarboxylate transporter permease [Deferrisomatales bacterium]